MRQSKASRPSPVFILAVLALVAAFAGTAIAGPDAISNKVTKSKVKTIAKKQINKAAPGLSVAEAKKAGNAERLGGDPASAYLKGTGVRFVRINSDGTINTALSKGVTQANVTTDGPGNYCISGLDPAPLNAQAAIDFGGSPFNAQIYITVNPTVTCNGKQVWISTFNPTNKPTNMPTYVALFN